MPMSSGGRVVSSSGCVTRPKGQEIGSTGYAGPTQRSLLIGHCVMATAEHREPCDSRGSCTVLGAPRGEIPPGDSTKRAWPATILQRLFLPKADIAGEARNWVWPKLGQVIGKSYINSRVNDGMF